MREFLAIPLVKPPKIFMVSQADESITRLLARIRSGDAEARTELLQSVYEELRQVATGLMRHERGSHTLQATALLNEAVMRLFDIEDLAKLQNRPHFFAAAARAMRQILIEHARRRQTARQGGGWRRIQLDDVLDQYHEQKLDLAALHEAIDDLGTLDARQRQVIELRFFWGFTMSEVAQELEVSVATVESLFRKARAYLRGRIEQQSVSRAGCH